MRAALLGFFGALLALLCAALVYPNYSDYRASAEVSGWLANLQQTQKAVEANFARNQSLASSGSGVPSPSFATPTPAAVSVSDAGVILVQGGRANQLVVLVPTVSSGKVVWSCWSSHSRPTPACKHVP